MSKERSPRLPANLLAETSQKARGFPRGSTRITGRERQSTRQWIDENRPAILGCISAERAALSLGDGERRTFPSRNVSMGGPRRAAWPFRGPGRGVSCAREPHAVSRPDTAHSGDPGHDLGLADTAVAATGAPGMSRRPPVIPASVPPLQPGAVVKHYEIIRQLGAGGMGLVFLARDMRLGRLVAVKFLLEYSGPAAQRFLAEAQATALCRHENIVVIYDIGELHGYPYMVLEYIAGRSLRAAVVERTRDGASVAVELMLPVARALACAHAMGIVHRDLKPENILVSDAGQIKVLDFGIAKHIAVELSAAIPAGRVPRAEAAGLTEDGALVGTLPYMSPEQLSGEPVDARTDIWAAGIILFELLTGAHPLHPLSTTKLADLLRPDVPMPSARERSPEAAALAEVIDRCLRKRKADRLGSAAELVEAIEALYALRARRALVEDESPFAGLAAFQESDAGRFFGREHDIAAVIGRLRNQELVAVAGPSGAGKSSFVRAGLIPALKRADREAEAFLLRPGRRPLAALADVLAFLADTSADAEGAGPIDPEAVVATLRSQPGYLGARLRARSRRRGNHRIVVFVDQLEELYTLGIEPAERAAFCACLEGVADDASSPLRVIVTMRADFLERLSADRRFSTAVTRGLVLLPPMTRDALRDALHKPLEAARYRFEDDALVEEMLDGLEGTKSPLPILQFAATKLWEARDRDRRLLTRSAYLALGGVVGALSTHADAVLSGLSTAEQRLARAVLARLVTPERTRAIVAMGELMALDGDGAAVEQVVQRLADARLLVVETGGEREGKTVEITHESLLDRWVKLRRWLDADEQDAQFLGELRHAAQQWEKNGEAEGLLWRDRAASEAGAWLDRRRAGGTSGLGKREERYLDAVVRLSQRTRRRRRQITAAVIAATSATAVAVSVLAVRARDQAKRADVQATRADVQARRADVQAKAAQDEARQARGRGIPPRCSRCSARSSLRPRRPPRGRRRPRRAVGRSSPGGRTTPPSRPLSSITMTSSAPPHGAPTASASSPARSTRWCACGASMARARRARSLDTRTGCGRSAGAPTAGAWSRRHGTGPSGCGAPTAPRRPSSFADIESGSFRLRGARTASASSPAPATRQCACGAPTAPDNRSSSKDMTAPSSAWRSRRTANTSPRPRSTGRCACGTPTAEESRWC